jgi:formylglycine-generating enzyme required for sulfatase activity
MGSPENEVNRIAERETQHEVKLSDFYIGETTITQGQWQSIMGNNPSHFKNGDNYPVENVSWEDVQVFIEKINAKNPQSKYIFRLPTEAEWEYACRAGTTTPFNTGENLTTNEANYNGNYPYNGNAKGKYLKKTSIVASYPPNILGLFDMHGNLWEWCEDWYQDWYFEWCKKQGVIENPTGPATGELRVLRGGSWDNFAWRCRSANRSNFRPGNRSNRIGFRLVCSPVS